MVSKKMLISVLLIIIVAVAVYVALHLYNPAAQEASISGTAIPAAPKEFDLVVKNGQVVQGSGDITVTQGDTVKLVITNDGDNELHLHGYNLMIDLKAGEPGTITFQATASGRFPFELEETKQDLGAISVMPR